MLSCSGGLDKACMPSVNLLMLTCCLACALPAPGAATLQQGAGTAVRRSMRLLLNVGATAGSTVTALAGGTTTLASLVLATLTAMLQASTRA
jgi:hypothetical protein